jgi:hypothetical protein
MIAMLLLKSIHDFIKQFVKIYLFIVYEAISMLLSVYKMLFEFLNELYQYNCCQELCWFMSIG